jgi:hypothetical protein
VSQLLRGDRRRYLDLVHRLLFLLTGEPVLIEMTPA